MGDDSVERTTSVASVTTPGNGSRPPADAAGDDKPEAPGSLRPGKISGTVYQEGTEARIDRAVVKATREADGVMAIPVITDDDGDYTIENVEPGSWALVALKEHNGISGVVRVDMNPGKDSTGVAITLPGLTDSASGRNFLYALCTGFVALIALYVLAHLFLTEPSEPLSKPALALINQARSQVSAAATISTSVELTTTFQEISSALNSVFAGNPQVPSNADKQYITGLVNRTGELIRAGDKGGVTASLDALRAIVSAPLPGSYFWVKEPFRFVEILLWGLAGVLASLILTTGTYLRRDSYYRTGFYQHLASLIVVPVAAVVIVLILSLVTLSLTLPGNNQLTLDLSDPRILAAISFLIGFRPGVSYRLLRETADSVLQRGDRGSSPARNN